MRPIVLAVAVLVGVAECRADSYIFTIPPLPDGSPISSIDSSLPTGQTWLMTAQPSFDGSIVGPGNPFYTGSDGITFPTEWSFGYQQGPSPTNINWSGLSVVIQPDAASPEPIDLTVTAPNAGVSWDWNVTAGGTYTLPISSFSDDALVFSGTGDWQITRLTIDFTPTTQTGPPIPFVGGGGGTGPGGPGGGMAPEPSSVVMGFLGFVAVLMAGMRRGR